MQSLFPDPVEPNVTLYGRTAAGLPLTERTLWSGEKSLLAVTGFCLADDGIARQTEVWFSDLAQGEKQGETFLGFDLKSLKKRGKIRIISRFDPSTDILYRNGINKSKKSIDNNGFSENQFYNRRGVDLYRNFGSDWIKSHRDPAFSPHCGPFPESESEVAAFTAHVRRNPPHSALILRQGSRGIFYPPQATEGELREAQFLARYAALPLFRQRDGGGTLMQWWTDRGVKVLELHGEGEDLPCLRKFLTMCVALL